MADVASAAGNPYWQVVEARSADDRNVIVKYGVSTSTYRDKSQSGTSMSYFFGIVEPMLKEAAHLFRGLKRPLWYEGDAYADQSMLVYAWLPINDYEYVDGKPRRREPGVGRVFVVLVRTHAVNAHGISGELDQWNWVEADVKNPGVPRDWPTRYGEECWK